MFTPSFLRTIPLHSRTALMIAVTMALMIGNLHAGTASDSSTFLGNGVTILYTIYSYAKTTIYIGAALGLIVMAVLAFFGRFGWTRFFSICGGVFIVALADQLFTLVTNGSATAGVLSGAGLL